MADNIKIVGNIISTTTVSRYSNQDINLIPSTKLNESFGGKNDYIEFYIYDTAGNLLNINYNYLNYKLPPSNNLLPGTSTQPNTTGNIQTTNIGINSTLSSPTSSLYPIIEIDPIQDLQNTGYSSGEFNTRYNLFTNILSNSIDKALFIKEISQDRTEIRLASISLTNDEIETTVMSMIDEINNSSYYIDYLLNFGNNIQILAVNVALNKAQEGYEVLFKLYEPLPLEIQEKMTLWVVEEKTNPYVFDINLDKLISQPAPQQLQGPNFSIKVPNQGTISTTYTDYSTSLLSLQSLQSSSYNQILNLIATQSIQINVDYTDFNNFVFFGSAYQRLANFYTKVKQIETYNTFINYYTPYIATTASFQNEINKASASISTLISQFDGYESYLYFESSSYTWPKSGSLKPFSLLSTGSATVINWYNTLTSSAKAYDLNNYDNLEYTVPAFIKDDGNNTQYLTFLNMVGQYFDNIWIYLKAITDINLANNNLNKGISKDLVYTQLQSLGIKLYNSQAGDSVANYLIGANTGSSIFDDNFSITGSYLNNIPRKDLVSELYKRIYHNLPLLLKTKGTKTGLEYLISTFGIPSDQAGYPSVTIGSLEWMTSNLDVDRYRNGDIIPQITSSAEWMTTPSGAWCYYNNDPALGAIYGKIYNQKAINDPRGLAPAGWKIAGSTEWNNLITYLGETPGPFNHIGNYIKQAGTSSWNNPNTGTNSTGLTILGGGIRDYTGAFSGKGTTVQMYYSSSANKVLYNDGDGFDSQIIVDTDGMYVRCVKIYGGNDKSILTVKEYGGSLKSNLIKGYNDDKVRIISNTITGSVLSPILSLQTYPTASSQFRENDMHYVDISFSPQTQIDTYISKAITFNNPTWSLDNYIGDPRQQYTSTYPDLDTQRQLYFQTGVTGFAPFTGSLLNYNDFIRLIEYFDNSLFKMLEDFVPERTSLSTGVTIASPVLERNKVAYANPTNSTTQSVYTAQYSIATINSQYGNFYNTLSSSNNSMGWFDGELSGSTVNVYQYFTDNANPYLQPTGTIDQNAFAHSDWNVLLNNVSSSILSTKRKKIDGNTFNYAISLACTQYTIYGGLLGKVTWAYVNCATGLLTTVRVSQNSSIIVCSSIVPYFVTGDEPTSDPVPGADCTILNITNPAELQDSYLSLRSYNTSRYEGSRLTSLKYNTYTSGSYTGSDGFTIQTGDQSYGKTAVIDQYVRKIGLFTSLDLDPYFDRKTDGALKYLVDESGSLTELNHENKHWEEVQNTFKAGNNQIISLFDNKKYTDQRMSDGPKGTFNSGYLFTPLFYYSNTDKTASFQYAGYSQANMFKYTTVGGTLGSGSSYYYKLDNTTDGGITNIFGTSDIAIYNDGNLYTSSSIGFGSYTVSETGYYGFQLDNLKITATNNLAAGTYPKYYFFISSSYGIQTFFSSSNSPKNVANLGGIVDSRYYTSGSKIYFGIGRTSGVSAMTESINAGATFQSLRSSGAPYALSPFTSSISTTQFCLDEQFAILYGYLFLPQGYGSYPSSSLYPTYGNINDSFSINPGDYIIFKLSGVSYEYEIASVDVTQGAVGTGSLCINVNGTISTAVVGSIASVSQVLILRKTKDETNIMFTYSKPSGSTSYGFLLPENLSPSVLANIDTITKEVKQKLLADQQGQTSN